MPDPRSHKEGQESGAQPSCSDDGYPLLGKVHLPLFPDFGEAHLSGVAGLEVVYLSYVHCLESCF